MSTYAVVQERFEQIDASSLEEALREQGGLTRADAVRIARRGQGILWERFTLNQAEHVSNTLATYGFPTRVVPTSHLPKLENARTIHWLEIDEDGLTIPGKLHQTATIVWPCVFVISAGQVGQTVEKTGRSSSSVRSERLIGGGVERESHLISVTDLIAVSDAGETHYVRLPSHELAYGRILKPSDEVRTSFQKYLEVLDELVSRSSSAIVSPRTRRLLVERREQKHVTPRTAAWAGVDDLTFKEYNRWLLQLVVFKEQGKDQE